MTSEKCLKSLASKLEINQKLAEKIYDKYWKYIILTLNTQDSVEIEDFGTFFVEETVKNNEKIKSIKFKPFESFLSKLKG